jgi:hypothetical protein
MAVAMPKMLENIRTIRHSIMDSDACSSDMDNNDRPSNDGYTLMKSKKR